MGSFTFPNATGNTGGLSGAVGIKYASGEGELDFVVRPFPVAIGRLKKTILSPLTKISADDYILDSTQVTRNDDDGDTDTVESRKALTSARMRIQEEDAKKKLIEAEAVERLRAQQEAEEEKARAQQQADEELRRIRQEIEQQMYKRQDESKEESQQAATVNIPDLKFPTPPKVLPPKDLLPKVPKASQKVPSPSKAVTAKDSQAYSFSNVFKPLSKLSMPKAPSFDGILPKFDSMREMNDDVIQNKKRATVDVRIREQAKLDEQKATAAKQKAVFEEARKVRLEEQKLAAEQKKIDLAKRKAAAAAALASKNAVVNAAITKRKEEDEKNRRESEKRRQEAISKGVDALAGAFSTFQSQPYPMVKKERKQSEKGLKSPPARPLRRTQGAEPEAKAPQSPPRPSFQIPQFVNSEQDSRPKQPPTSRPRPSLQIPQSIKPSQKGKVDEESKSALLKPRPTLQIPKLAKIGVKAESTLAPPNTRPTITTPKEALPRQSLQIPKSSSAPRGVPSIVAWQKLRNGGVSGQIFGSTNFKEGERIETSTIATGKLENGSIIITESGSKYFLSGESAREITTATFNSATKLPDATRSKPRATLELTKLSKELNANAVQAALESQSKATTTASQQKRPTFSLKDIFGIDKSSDIRKPKDKATANESMTPPSPKTPAPLTKQAPKGMPTISRWKQKRDKSITGFISGSTAFPDGEKITTSPIARGVVEPGEVVTTSSGTKYFLQ